MANPVTTPPAAPDLFSADMSRVLAGQMDWAAAGPLAVKWFLATGLTVVLVVVLAVVAARAYCAGVDRVFRLINANLKPDALARVTQRTATLSAIVRSLGRVIIYFLAGVIVLSKLGVNVAPILASAGILGLAVGFGAQSLVKDVISGFFILVEDQYGVGDVVELNGNGKSGLVEKMNLRITQIRNMDGQLITIPNGTITLVVNHSKEWSRAVLEVGVAFGEDPDRVITVLKEIGEEIQSEMPDKILEPIEVLGVEAFREYQLVIKLFLKTVPLEQWTVARAFRRKVWYRFQQEGIALPYPQRTLSLATEQQEKLASLVLRGAVPASQAPNKAEQS